MRLKCLILSVILISFFCVSGFTSENQRKSLLLISVRGDNKLPSSENLSIDTKSPTKAALFSLALPGTGELYSGAKRGYIHMAAEVGLFAAYIFLNRDAEQMREDCKEKIRQNVKFDPEYSGSKDFESWGWEDYEHATMFNNWRNVYTESEGKPIERVGPFYWPGYEDATEEEVRTYSELRQEALDLRENSNDHFQLARGFIGGIILNHLISAIDARILAKKHNEKINREPPVTFKMDFSSGYVRGKLLFEKQF